MKRREHPRLLPALLFLATACGGPTASESPSLAAARLAPGTTLPVVVRFYGDPRFLTNTQIVLANGSATEVVPFTICGLTVAHRSELVLSPAPDPPAVGGAINYQIFAAQPIPSGTRLEVSHTCGSALDGTFTARVLQGVN